MALRSEPRFLDLDKGAGHYESFYIKASSPKGGLGIWIRHTVHKRPDAEIKASIWFVLFDADADGPVATKVTVPAAELSGGGDKYIRVNGAELGDGTAVGAIDEGGVRANWDLTFSDDAEPFYFLPRMWMYKAKLPKTKFLSPYPNAFFNGKLTVNDREIDISRWPGMIGHNWGTEHAERWVWMQATNFADRPAGTYFDAGAARIKVGPLTVPWIANGRLVIDGTEHRLGGIERMRSTKIDEKPAGCEFRLSGSDVKIEGAVTADHKDFVGWTYADPVGSERETVNCSISNMELLVERKGHAAETLAVRGGAAYEFGSTDTDHDGIPIQPFPDG